jgi:hypothetical protein
MSAVCFQYFMCLLLLEVPIKVSFCTLCDFVCAENLEMLERGEMKREFSGLSSVSGGGCGTSTSGGEESDDELGGSAPPTPLTPLSASQQHMTEFIDINQLTGGGGTDSFDESSLTGFDIEVGIVAFELHL